MTRLGVQEPAAEPGRVRTIFMDGERMCVEVRWDAEDSVTVFGPESIRPRAKVAISEAAASGPSAASTATPSAGASPLGYAQGAYSVASSSQGAYSVNTRSALQTWVGRDGYDVQADDIANVESLAVHGIHGAPLEALLRESVTPSQGFLTPESVMCHPWICHMCCKKFMSAECVPAHLTSNMHAKKRRLPYRILDWIEHNRFNGFYEVPVQLSETLLQAVLPPIQDGDGNEGQAKAT